MKPGRQWVENKMVEEIAVEIITGVMYVVDFALLVKKDTKKKTFVQKYTNQYPYKE